MEYHYEILPKEMRVTDRIFWDSAASIYGDIWYTVILVLIYLYLQFKNIIAN